jgi:hypothetical protein
MVIKKEHILLIFILIIGIIARIIKFEDPAMVMDTVAFSRLGKNLIESGRYVFGENYNMGVFFPPGYPFFIGIANIFFNDLFFSAKLISFAASCITILFSYFIGRELYNSEAGLFAALVFAVHPVILIISVDSYADALFLCILVIFIYLFIRSLAKGSMYFFPLLGFTAAMLFLTRPEGLLLLVLPALQLFGVFESKIRFNRKYLTGFIFINLIFVFTVSPYLLYITNYSGKFTLSGKSNISILVGELSGDREYHFIVNAPDNLYDRAAFTLNEDKTQLRGWNKKANLSLKDYLLRKPVNLLQRYQRNLLEEIKVLVKLLIPIILPLFLAFFNRELCKKKTRLIFIIFPLVLFLMYPLFIIIEKQTLLVVAFLIFFSSGGYARAQSVISDIANYYGSGENKIVLRFGENIKYIIIILLILSGLSYLKYSSFDKAPMPVEHERAGVYLREHITSEYEKLNVMARKPYVNFYSGARFTMIPYANVSDVINFSKLYDVDYIVIDERSLSRWDYYNELIDMQKSSDEVELFYEDSSEEMIRIFKVRKQQYERE